MIEQIKTDNNNLLAIEIIDCFTETDLAICEFYFSEKLDQGYDNMRLLIKVDEKKLSKSNIKTFFNLRLQAFRNFKAVKYTSVLTQSNIIKTYIKDELFFKKPINNRQERYFDMSQIDQAYQFVNITIN